MDHKQFIETIQEGILDRQDVKDLMTLDVHNQMDHLKEAGLEFNTQTYEEMVCRLKVEWMTKFMLDLIP